MSKKESTSRTLLVALAVSLVSSIFVAGAAVSLKPVQIDVVAGEPYRVEVGTRVLALSVIHCDGHWATLEIDGEEKPAYIAEPLSLCFV